MKIIFFLRLNYIVKKYKIKTLFCVRKYINFDNMVLVIVVFFFFFKFIFIIYLYEFFCVCLTWTSAKNVFDKFHNRKDALLCEFFYGYRGKASCRTTPGIDHTGKAYYRLRTPGYSFYLYLVFWKELQEL